MPLNRVVVLLTPVFSLVSAVVAGWLAKHFPGLPTPSAGDVLGIEIAGATSGLAAALAWLRGHHILLAKAALAEPGDPDALPDVPTVAVVPADKGDAKAA